MSNRVYTWTGNEENHDYDEIIGLPHYVSTTCPHMSMIDRAAQFSPFDALTGFDDSITEEGRMTDQKTDLSEQDMTILNEKMALLSELCAQAQRSRFNGDQQIESPVVTATYFVADAKLHRRSKKEGGAYISHTGPVKRVDMIEGKLIFYSEKPGSKEISIPTQDIIELQSDALADVDSWYE